MHFRKVTAAYLSCDCEQSFSEDMGSWSWSVQSEVSFMDPGKSQKLPHTLPLTSLLPPESVNGP